MAWTDTLSSLFGGGLFSGSTVKEDFQRFSEKQLSQWSNTSIGFEATPSTTDGVTTVTPTDHGGYTWVQINGNQITLDQNAPAFAGEAQKGFFESPHVLPPKLSSEDLWKLYEGEVMGVPDPTGPKPTKKLKPLERARRRFIRLGR